MTTLFCYVENVFLIEQELLLVLAVVRPRIGHVVQHIIGIETEPFTDLDETFGSECILCIDIEGLSLASSLGDWELTNHT